MAGRRKLWVRCILVSSVALVVFFVCVVAARAFRDSPWGSSFLHTYSGVGTLPANAPVGIPTWLSWQHFFHAFLLIVVVRSGWLIRTTVRPEAHWTRKNRGFWKTRRPPVTLSIHQWFHLVADALWMLNGVIFWIMLLVTGQWMRIVPTTWDIVPQAFSALIQYASLSWPVERAWTSYNGLQMVLYTLTVFVAAPLSVATGLRLMPGLRAWWADRAQRFPLTWARRLHFGVMVYFVVFAVVHVVMVLATDALRNLNAMYGGRDEESWWGAGIFAVSLVCMVGAWCFTRPLLFRSVAALSGKVTR